MRIHALVLAAGQSRRMGGPNKLLATFDGQPLVRRTVETALACGVARVFAVLGHQAEQVEEAIRGLAVSVVRNAHYAQGLSSSLRAGFKAAAEGCDGVLVLLADQPGLRPENLRMLIDQFRPDGAGRIVVATAGGRRGNPVILSCDFADEIDVIRGDTGARDLVRREAASVVEVEIGAAALLDVDTPEAMRRAGGRLPGDAPAGRS